MDVVVTDCVSTGKTTVTMTFNVNLIEISENGYRSPTPFLYCGQWWGGHARNWNDNLELFVVPSNLTRNMCMEYCVRIISGVEVYESAQEKFPLKVTDKTWQGHDAMIKWDDLLEKFCKDDKFTIEFVFPYFAPTLTPMTLKTAIFTDVQVACENSEEMIDCNKNIICLASKVMCMTLSNPTSKESIENKFTITHEKSTKENTQLFIRCMYEGWLAILMDDHARELLEIANCYDCSDIVKMAMDSLKRQLTNDEFWLTTKVAVLLQTEHPGLLQHCAGYADKLGVNVLLKRDDHGDNDVIAALALAVAALH